MALVGVELSNFFLFFVIEVYASWIMALVGIELETLVSESDALTTRLRNARFRVRRANHSKYMHHR